MDQLEKKFPDLTSAINPKADREINVAIRRIYEYIDLEVTKIKNELVASSATQEQKLVQVDALLGDFATKLIGEDISNPLEQLGTGEGTVTSIGLDGSPSVDSIFSISNTPIVTSGNIGIDLVPQAANKVFAGPTSGSAKPTFRSLIASDIPAVTAGPASQLDADGTILDVNAIPNGGYLVRSGATVVGYDLTVKFPISALVTTSVTLNPINNNWNKLNWDTTLYDFGPWHGAAPGHYALFIPITGNYLIRLRLSLPAISSGGLNLGIGKNGVDANIYFINYVAGTPATEVNVAVVAALVAGDHIFASIYPTHAIPMAPFADRPFFGFSKIG